MNAEIIRNNLLWRGLYGWNEGEPAFGLTGYRKDGDDVILEAEDGVEYRVTLKVTQEPKPRSEGFMDISVSPLVRSGTGRGDEDLSLIFVHECDDAEIPDTKARIVFGLCPDDCLAHIESGSDPDACRLEITPDSVVALADGKASVVYTTHNCGFAWSGGVDDALEIVHDALRIAKYWHFCHSPGEPPRLRFEYTHFVNGNAE